MEKMAACLTLSIISKHLQSNSIYSLEAPDQKIYKGIDISKWQGDVDFAKVKESGVEVVYIKASEGIDYIDPNFEKNYAGAKAQGLKIGFYHFLTATTKELAKRQADFFASIISDKQYDCKPAMDYEVFGNLTKDQINEIALTFLDELKEKTGKDVVIYTNTYSANERFDNNVAKYPIWVAQYGVDNPDKLENWPEWVGFQYSETGEVPGIAGFVDLDKFTDGIFLKPAEKKEPTPKPEAKPPTSPTPAKTQRFTTSENNTINYTIVRGDTLEEIAEKYNTTIARLAQLNNIQNPNLIYIGQVIKIN